MTFEVVHWTPIFIENGVAHSIHNGHVLDGLKDVRPQEVQLYTMKQC